MWLLYLFGTIIINDEVGQNMCQQSASCQIKVYMSKFARRVLRKEMLIHSNLILVASPLHM